MDFDANKTPVKVIIKGAFERTYFRNIYSGVNKYKVKCGTSLRFWESSGWINSIDLYGWFQWYFRYGLGRRSLDDKRQINRWKRIVSRLKGKLVRMIKGVNESIDDYSISPKIKHILLHWIYELVENNFL